MKYKRILLKLSGEALMGDSEYGINPVAAKGFADEVAMAHQLGIQIGIVIGGGNIFRGIQAAAKGINKIAGDQMGMLATVINATAFQNILESIGIKAIVQTATEMRQFAETFTSRNAISYLEQNNVVIFAGGTGNPFFTTDSAAALRAIEINADIMIKATSVDGVYDSDPKKNPDAKFIKNLSYIDVIQQDLRVMDHTAIILCHENNKPVAVINLRKKNNLIDFLNGKDTGTVIQK